MNEQRIREIVREEMKKAAFSSAAEVVLMMDKEEIARIVFSDALAKEESKKCYSCGNQVNEQDNFCNKCGFGLTKPKLVYDHSATVKKLLHVLVEDQVLIDQVDRVLDMLREAVMTSSRVQEIWAADDYNGYKELPLK